MNPWLAVLAVVLSTPALAQNKPADPADPKAAVAPLRYESALGGYRGASEDKPAPWKQVNEEVAGAARAGHGEAKGAVPSAEPSKTPAAKPGSMRPEGAQPAKPSGHSH